MNEFLSAAVATRLLQDHITLPDLITVLACIEATIPFRAPVPPGQDCSLELAERVRQLGRQRRRGGSPVTDETSTILQQAEAADAGGGDDASAPEDSALTLPGGAMQPVGAGDVETRKPSPIPFVVAGVAVVGAILWWRRRKKGGRR
jgi:hypothetical protein